MKKEGVCFLTGKRGGFVKAHIIPEALTKPSIAGEHFIQAGRGERPVKRWTSWYDPSLVTVEGEKILAAYDSWGIAELRRLKLVWSSWHNGKTPEFADWQPMGDTGHGVRIIEYSEGEKLRLFLLSILWRAAASRLPEFRNVRLAAGQLRRLGQMLVNQTSSPDYLFPACLVQLSTYGPRHNYTPTADRKSTGSTKRKSDRIFRFYFDGLILHFHRDLNKPSWKSMGDMAVQPGKQLGIITVPYEISRQVEILDHETNLAELEWSDVIRKLA